MKDNFDACLNTTLAFEGGFVDNPHDPGGATNMGVTRHTLSAWRKRPVATWEVRGLGRDEAAQIYRALYWAPINGDALAAGVDLMLFDIGVNMGVGRAESFARATAAFATRARIERLDGLRCGFWRRLRTFPVFGRGWMRRETAVLARAKAMAA